MKIGTKLSNLKLSQLWKKATSASEQFYSPKEFRALLTFLLIGVSVLLYRGGRSFYYQLFPEKIPAAQQRTAHRNDSLFHVLSARQLHQDSMIFYLPEDSLREIIEPTPKQHSKTDGLARQSISLNRGTQEDLMKLPSVGAATAKNIVSYRKERSGFRSLEELRNIKGIGEKRLEQMRPYLRLN